MGNGKQQQRCVTNIFVQNTSVLNSGIGGLHMHTLLAYQTTYATETFVNFMYISAPHKCKGGKHTVGIVFL